MEVNRLKSLGGGFDNQILVFSNGANRSQLVVKQVGLGLIRKTDVKDFPAICVHQQTLLQLVNIHIFLVVNAKRLAPFSLILAVNVDSLHTLARSVVIDQLLEDLNSLHIFLSLR